MADILGTNVAAAVVPFTTADNYPTHRSEYGKGGWHEVANTAARDAIPTERKTTGMAVYVTGLSQLHIWNGATWDVFYAGQAAADLTATIFAAISAALVAGTGISLTVGATTITINSGLDVYDDGVFVGRATKLNLIGETVNAYDAGGGEIIVTIGGTSSVLPDTPWDDSLLWADTKNWEDT